MADANLTRLIDLYRDARRNRHDAQDKALRAAKRVTLLALLAVSVLIFHLLSALHGALLS